MAFQCDLIQHCGAQSLAPAWLGNILALYALITSQNIYSPPPRIGHSAMVAPIPLLTQLRRACAIAPGPPSPSQQPFKPPGHAVRAAQDVHLHAVSRRKQSMWCEVMGYEPN